MPMSLVKKMSFALNLRKLLSECRLSGWGLTWPPP